MGLFRKESKDIVDFTMLQKRGILKKEKEPVSAVHIDPKTGFVDLTSSATASSSPAAPAQDIFGFLDASASSSSTMPPPPSESSENIEIQSLKVKMDDLEFKIERLLEKLAVIESKFNNP